MRRPDSIAFQLSSLTMLAKYSFAAFWSCSLAMMNASKDRADNSTGVDQ